MPRRTTALATAITAIALAGCGSSGHHAQRPALGDLSESELAAQADGICLSAGSHALANLRLGPDDAAAHAAKALNQLGPLQQILTRELALLKPAPSVAARWRRYLGAQERATRLLMQAAAQATHDQRSYLDTVHQAEAQFALASPSARALGAVTCAN